MYGFCSRDLLYANTILNTNGSDFKTPIFFANKTLPLKIYYQQLGAIDCEGYIDTVVDFVS